MKHLAPAPGTTRFLCCFQSSLMLKPGDSVTEDPAQVDCQDEISYDAFEKILTAPMDRHNAKAEAIKQLIWEMLVERRVNTSFQILPENRREFLETFGKRLRKLEESEEDEGKDLLLAVRKNQVSELKRIGKAFRQHSANLSTALMRVLVANPAYPLDEVPAGCLKCGTSECVDSIDCQRRAAMVAHNSLVRDIEKLLTHDPLA